MAALLHGEDPEPSERGPAGPLFVPVRPGPAGYAARVFRTPLGGRTAVGFTTPDRLSAALGPDQRWTRLAEPALRALVRPLGVTTVTVDPLLCIPRSAPGPRDAAATSEAGVRACDAAPAAEPVGAFPARVDAEPVGAAPVPRIG
ncbi:MULTISPECIES: SAV_915 family protein [unclassified Streptomyces]|uniref:SAV_915 family protein n=1 Tax=unclassified Streptomyces TaxID=2593676 RepID=UPI001F0DDA91|nr:SAV_915 family protein [Streptomyces sp. A1136]